MRVPRELLRSTVTVIDYGGSGARGAVYSDSREVRARIEPTSRLITDATGRQVTVDLRAIIRPEDGPVRPESVVVHAGTRYRVVQSYPMPDDRRPYHWELGLTRTAVATGIGSGS